MGLAYRASLSAHLCFAVAYFSLSSFLYPFLAVEFVHVNACVVLVSAFIDMSSMPLP